MIKRDVERTIKKLFRQMPLVAVVGPRQSGKSTLLKSLYPKIKYVSLEDPDRRLFAREDPRRFLSAYGPPAIIDEVQQAPELFSYLQTLIDDTGRAGQYLLSGSQNFLLLSQVSQSLAGRVGLVTLLPFSFNEAGVSRLTADELMFKGFYPRIWDKHLDSAQWYSGYVQTYLEKDVRQIKNITNLILFQKFLKLAAGRTGQSLNLSSLGNEVGVNHNTIQSWLSILEASFITFRLPPYYRNINKRLVKTPKLYFYDTGLAASLMEIDSARQLASHPLRGALFETMIVNELIKKNFNRGQLPRAYYLQDKSGHEVDLIFKQQNDLLGIEIKAGETTAGDYFDNLIYWQGKKLIDKNRSLVIYGGRENQPRESGRVMSWRNLNQLARL